MDWSCALSGSKNSVTCFRSQSSFRCITRFPSWLVTPIITLLLCRSIPAINLSLGLLMVLFVVVNSLRTTTFYRGETFVSIALNVYQLMVSPYKVKGQKGVDEIKVGFPVF